MNEASKWKRDQCFSTSCSSENIKKPTGIEGSKLLIYLYVLFKQKENKHKIAYLFDIIMLFFKRILVKSLDMSGEKKNFNVWNHFHICAM